MKHLLRIARSSPAPPSLILAATLTLVVAAPAWAQMPPTISVDELEVGQKGYGMSVFQGTEPERFEVEVLGVIRNSTPELSYVLARLSGHDLERGGVAAGMSGSPVYIDGRLAGAVSFGYPFGLDAIAGITPIGGMQRLSEAPQGARLAGAGSPAAPGSLQVSFEQLARRELGEGLLERHLALLAPPPRPAGSPAISWTAAGFGRRASSLLETTVGELAPLAGRSPAARAELRPGSAVSVVLVEGDLNLAAHGTVTARDRDEVLAFGHPVFALGPALLPMGTSEVITVIANRSSSFKISNVGPVVGAFDQDRQAGMRGIVGSRAPTIPLTVRLRGLVDRDYGMRVAALPQLTPLLLSLASLGALDAGSYATGEQSLDARFRFELEDRAPLVVEQSFDGLQAGLDSVMYMLGFSAYLALNPLESVRIEAVEVELEQSERPRTATLVRAFSDRREVEPGERVPIVLELQPYRGERLRRTVEVELPADLEDGRYYLLVGDGTSMDAARLAIEQPTPETFEQSLRMMRGFGSRRDLQIFGLRAAPGLSVAGEVLPELPASVRALFAASGPPTGQPLSLTIHQEERLTLDQPIQGALRVDFDVRRRQG